MGNSTKIDSTLLVQQKIKIVTIDMQIQKYF